MIRLDMLFHLWLAIFALEATSTLGWSPLELNDVLPAPVSTRPLLPRQEENLTRTITPVETATEAVESITSDAGPTRTVPPLTVADKPIPLAATMGLIMPNPWSKLYAGVNYSFGFVDAVQRPAPTIGGWIRHVQPLLVFPNYTVDIFPGTGATSPGEENAIPQGSSGLCGATAENWAISYPFRFETPGWYMFVVNQTWLQPTVTNNTCQLPLISEKSFFSWQTLSIRPAPTVPPGPADPTSAYTVFADVTTSTPMSLPYDKQPTTAAQKLAVGLGVTAAIIALICIAGVIWWVRKKRLMERETLAFSRLSETDKAAFLAENPEHFLNPNRPSRRRDPSVPPAPPGTMAYAQWYWSQMRERQVNNWRWGRSPGLNQTMYQHRQGQYPSVGWNQAGWGGQGYGYQGVPQQGGGVMYPQQMGQMDGQPVTVYKTH